ncbi:MAG TPA: gliding motility-associated C-terminal domain-containing protein, partial [Bacteroidia bacterium]|nr:gliding motility-associated C-terminal domain-containing protein [Bacteroidia bacterium]
TYTDGINALDRPVADFSFLPEEPTMLNPEIDFKNQSQFATIYKWSFGDGTISTETNPINRYTTIGTYEVTLISSNTYCEDTITKTIEVTDQFSYYVPNSFSPNADGRNDVFTSQGTNIVSERMAIYNRWGMKIFESSAFPFNWNGRMQNTGDELPRGIYVYTISITDKFGKGHSYNGTVTLIK